MKRRGGEDLLYPPAMAIRDNVRDERSGDGYTTAKRMSYSLAMAISKETVTVTSQRRVSLAKAATIIIFVATNTCLLRQNNKSFLATKVCLSRET